MSVVTKVRRRFDSEFLEQSPEISIYMAAFGAVNELKRLHAARQARKKASRDYTIYGNLLRQFMNLAEATQRFDVVLPVDSQGGLSPFFWRWFNWWDDYVRSLPALRLLVLECALRGQAGITDEEASHLRPSGDWIGYRDTPAFQIIVPRYARLSDYRHLIPLASGS